MRRILSVFSVIFVGTVYGLSVKDALNQAFSVDNHVPNVPLIPPHLIEAAHELKRLSPREDNNSACLICEQVIDNIIALRRSNTTRDGMKSYLNKLCLLYTEWGSVGCLGRTNLEIDTILYIIDHREDLRAARFCAIHFQSYGCEDPNADNWTVLLPPKPQTVKNIQPTDEESVQILQITDVHLDQLYTPGSNSKCKEPLCCESGVPANESDAAGYWGDYNVCDMPWHTMENMMERILEKHKHIDWIYFTGDTVSHRSWASSIQSNSESLKLMYTLLAKTFPNKTVFPILGNHDAHPADFYSSSEVEKTSNVSTQWLLDLSANEWSRWLPNATQATIRKGGYYTVLVKPGFRIIALNNNVCYTANLWLVYENKDTYDQLKWLIEVLTEAERNGEKVHLLAHISPSDDFASCAKVWSREFRKIVLRFADTIVAQFNGHTHMDELRLYIESNEVKTVAFNGASFVSFIGSNPNYRIYEVNNKNMSVTDYSEYTFNLTQANLNASTRPNWYKLYSFKQAYDLPDLTLQSFRSLLRKMISNDLNNEFLEKYFRYTYRNSDIYLKQGCDAACKKRLVCLLIADETVKGINCANLK